MRDNFKHIWGTDKDKINNQLIRDVHAKRFERVAEYWDKEHPLSDDLKETGITWCKILKVPELRSLSPSLVAWVQKLEEAHNSPWFCVQELARVEEHWNTVHNGDTAECVSNRENGEECLEDFTMDESKHMIQVIMDNLVKSPKEK